ncbi:hypothetical protein F5Y15DRAFT_422356 [Xylariaceae sp. FL0016]|nr:hypothetical protein F5Y15DRAFT_422356 [Xylariaceae sp. FL0016]
MQSYEPRRLVTVRRIAKMSGISRSGTNLITIDGWTVVMPKKYRFQEGQLVVYIEIDSLLPDTTHFWEYCLTSPFEEGFLVKTTVINKHLSQGLVFHLGTFSEIERIYHSLQRQYPIEEAEHMLMQLTFDKMLGVTKCEEPNNLTHCPGALGPAPAFFPQPGCVRAQNYPGLLSRYGHVEFQITEKLDGVPMSIYCVQKSSQWYTALPKLQDSSQEPETRVGIYNRRYELSKTPDSWF